jgi:hypothetical protein
MWSANATNNFVILQNLTTCFGPYGPSSGDNYRNDIQCVLFRRFSFYCNTSILKNKEVVSCVCGPHIYNFTLYVYIVYVSNTTGCIPQR